MVGEGPRFDSRAKQLGWPDALERRPAEGMTKLEATYALQVALVVCGLAVLLASVPAIVDMTPDEILFGNFVQ